MWPNKAKVSLPQLSASEQRREILCSLFGGKPRGTAWAAYLATCAYIDHRSEARESNDLTKERDERLLRGAGDSLKWSVWKQLTG